MTIDLNKVIVRVGIVIGIIAAIWGIYVNYRHHQNIETYEDLNRGKDLPPLK